MNGFGAHVEELDPGQQIVQLKVPSYPKASDLEASALTPTKVDPLICLDLDLRHCLLQAGLVDLLQHHFHNETVPSGLIHGDGRLRSLCYSFHPGVHDALPPARGILETHLGIL